MSLIPSVLPISSSATLELKLAIHVGAPELQALLALVNDAYVAAERLHLAEAGQIGALSEVEVIYLPEGLRLQVRKLEIGTPNKITLAGSVKGLTAVATLLTAVIGVPISAATAYKTFAEGQKAHAEAVKIIEETEVIKQQRLRVKQLQERGNAPENLVVLSEESAHMLAFNLASASKLLVPQELGLAEQT
jgi:hypothetical protein